MAFEPMAFALLFGFYAGLLLLCTVPRLKVGLAVTVMTLPVATAAGNTFYPEYVTPTTVVAGVLCSLAVLWFLTNLYDILPMFKVLSGPALQPAGCAFIPEELPKVTILLPAYREATVVRDCVVRVFQSDYPKDRFDVLTLTEADDADTQKAVMSLAEEFAAEGYRMNNVVIQDDGHPRGKPRALVQGLGHATGDIIGVLDAEDLIDTQLLKKVAALMSDGHDVVQGILDMVNEDDGWYNRQLRAEYGYWYRHYMPMLSDSGLPVPLGGTTNFFRRSVFDEVGTWDENNVTEDYDLGVRLYAHRKRVGTLLDVAKPIRAREVFPLARTKTVGMLRSVTIEESPTTLRGFIRQRTRWQRGKMQTLAKFVKERPSSLRATLMVYYTGIFPHLGAINFTGIVASLLAYSLRAQLPSYFYLLSAFNTLMILFYCHNQYRGYLSATEPNTPHRRRKAIYIAATLPVYWVLQWYADLRAIKQHYVEPRLGILGTFWEKTDHTGRNLAYLAKLNAMTLSSQKDRNPLLPEAVL